MFKSLHGFLRWLAMPRYERRQALFAAHEYARQRRLGFPLLRFFPELEQEYRDSALTANAMRLRFSLTFGLLAILGFIVMDQWFGMGLQPGPVLAVLLLVSCPALIAPGLLSLMPRMRPHLYSVLFWGSVFLGISMVTVVILGKAINTWFPYESILLITFYVYGIGLLLPQAMLCGGLVMVLYLGLCLWLRPEPSSVMLYEAYYLAVTNGLGALMRYLYEYQDRLAFLMQRELTLHAQQDALTGLLNRRAFRRSAAVTWAQAAREGKPLGLLLLDLDGFKKLNDECGHLAGDEALIKAASIVRSHLRRPLDAGGRFGGDEIVAIWYDADPLWFKHALTQMVAQFAQANVPGVPELRASIGAITVTPKGGERFDEALRMADAKLYEVKRAGGGHLLIEAMASTVTPLHAAKRA